MRSTIFVSLATFALAGCYPSYVPEEKTAAGNEISSTASSQNKEIGDGEFFRQVRKNPEKFCAKLSPGEYAQLYKESHNGGNYSIGRPGNVVTFAFEGQIIWHRTELKGLGHNPNVTSDGCFYHPA